MKAKQMCRLALPNERNCSNFEEIECVARPQTVWGNLFWCVRLGQPSLCLQLLLLPPWRPLY